MLLKIFLRELRLDTPLARCNGIIDKDPKGEARGVYSVPSELSFI